MAYTFNPFTGNLDYYAAGGGTGPQGPVGPAVDGMDGEDGMMIPGATGLQGVQGATGRDGQVILLEPELPEEPALIPGRDGVAGAAGANGVTAFIVMDGLDGEDATAIPGAAGPTGAGGATGAPGVTTFIVMDGADGEDAQIVPGPQGVTGTGTTGAIGPAGSSIFGMDGSDGEDGMHIPGQSGTAGATGATGATGVSVIGLDGLDADEPMLVQGLTGATGATGSTGAQGLPGVAVMLEPDPADEPIVLPQASGAGDFTLGAYNKGGQSVLDSQFLLQYEQLRVASTDRFTASGTARVLLSDLAEDAVRGPFGELSPGGSIILGTPKAPKLSFTVPTDYYLDILSRVALTGAQRATLQGNANLWMTDDFKSRSRIVLSGGTA